MSKQLRLILSLCTVLLLAPAASGPALPQARAAVDGSSPIAGTSILQAAGDALTVEVTANPTRATVGTNVTFQVTITNPNTNTTTFTGVTASSPHAGGSITLSRTSLAPGEVATGSYSHTVAITDPDPLESTVIVEATAGLEPYNTSDTAVVDLYTSDVLITKEANPSFAAAGTSITYTITVTNIGPEDIKAIEVTDMLLGDITDRFPVVSETQPLPPEPDPGASISATVTRTLAEDDPDPLINLVTVTATTVSDNTVTDVSSARVDRSTGGLTVTKQADVAIAQDGDLITYTVQVTNNSSQIISDLSAFDPIADSPPTLPTTTLNPGEGMAFSYTHTVDTDPLVNQDTNPLINTITISGETDRGDPVSDSTSESVAIVDDLTPPFGSLDVSVRAVGCDSPCVVLVGDSLELSATVFNDGATTLINVVVTSPQAITAANPMGTLASGLTLQPGENHHIPFNVIVPLGTGSSFSVQVEAEGIDPTAPGTPVVAPPFELQLGSAAPRINVVLEADKTVAPVGDIITYTATISNPGDSVLQNISGIDSLVGTVIQGISLDPLASREFTYTYTVPEGSTDPLVNTLVVTGQTTFNRSVTDTDSTLINVQQPELFVTVAADRQTAFLGDEINYTVTIYNVGDGTIQNLQGSYVPATTTSGTGAQQRPHLQGGSVTIPVPPGGGLPEGATVVGTFTHVATSGDNNPLTFRVVITGQGFIGATPIPVTAERLITVQLVTVDASGNPIVVGTPIPGLAEPEVTKSTDQEYALPGGLVTWFVTVRNPGTDPITDITITDTLSGNSRAESVTINNGTIESQEENSIVARTGTLAFNQSAVLTIIARVDRGVLPNQLIENIGCAGTSGSTAVICDSATIRVAPEVELLPATGTVSADSTMHPEARTRIGVLLALLGLGGLLGFSSQGSGPGARLILIAAALVATVVIVVVVAALLINLGRSTEQPGAVAQATDTPASTVVAGDLTASPTAEAAQRGTEPPPFQASPTGMPVPSAGPTLTPTITPSPTPPFQPRYDRELYIPRLVDNPSMPIVDLPLRNNTWDVRDLGHNIGFLEGTTWVSEADEETGGNTVLAGHIQITDGVPGPFRELNQIEVGDTIFIAEGSTIYEFEVEEVMVVAPDDVGVSYPTRRPTLTLITCTTWNQYRGAFEERLVVRARPVRAQAY